MLIGSRWTPLKLNKEKSNTEIKTFSLEKIMYVLTSSRFIDMS